MKKLAVSLMLCCLCVFAASCFNKEDAAQANTEPSDDMPAQAIQTESEPIKEITLPFSGELPPNPFTSRSKFNTDLCSLIYDPLVKLGPNYKPEMYLASTITSVDTVHTVHLRRDATFSDGSVLTAEDVAISFMYAQAPESFYSGSLEEIVSCEISDSRTVVFRTTVPDADFANLLTFPIVKENANGKFIGTGRYLLSTYTNSLRRNLKHFKSDGGPDTVKLVEFDSSQGLLNSLRKGTVSCIFTDSPDWSATYLSNKTESVDLNRLVLLGINGQRGALSNAAFRQAVYKAINQQSLSRNAFKSTAIPTSIPFNPSFYRLDNSITTSSSYSPLDCAALLEGLGYQKNEDGFYNSSPFRLIVNKESTIKRNAAKIISEQLAACGILTEVFEYSFEEYKANLVMGSYDLYIGEIAIPRNMNISSVLTPSTNAGFGSAYSYQLLSEYSAVRSGNMEYSKFLETFYEVVPFVPLAYRNGILAFTNDFSADILATEQDIFYNIDQW